MNTSLVHRFELEKKRVDWWERHPEATHELYGYHDKVSIIILYYDDQQGNNTYVEGATLRECIDLALKEPACDDKSTDERDQLRQRVKHDLSQLRRVRKTT